MQSLLSGLLTNRGSLRAVERQSALLSAARVPDATLYDLLSQFDETDEAALRTQLHAQVKSAWRSKSLEPVGLPCGVAAVDNKTLWSGQQEDAKNPAAQVVHPPNCPAYATLRAVRTVLISAASKPAIDQTIIPAHTNEGGHFPQVFAVLEENYEALSEIYSVDAGFCSLSNMDLIAQAQKGYLAALKQNQPTLYAEAVRVFGGTDRAGTQYAVGTLPRQTGALSPVPHKGIGGLPGRDAPGAGLAGGERNQVRRDGRA